VRRAARLGDGGAQHAGLAAEGELPLDPRRLALGMGGGTERGGVVVAQAQLAEQQQLRSLADGALAGTVRGDEQGDGGVEGDVDRVRDAPDALDAQPVEVALGPASTSASRSRSTRRSLAAAARA
jgi:hypothetical protein